MNEEGIKAAGYELCHMISATLHGELITGVNCNDYILQMASDHSLLMLALASLPQIPDNWQKRSNVIIARSMYMEYEREELYEFLREHNVWYMPMKGLVLRGLYPEPIYREMCDNDILYDERAYDKVKQWFLKRRYETEYNAEHIHVDEYVKKPYFNFEMHKRFFSFEYAKWNDYYSDVERLMVPVDEYERRLSDEDLYVYVTLHAYKHYSNSGTGLRSVVDIYLLSATKELDWGYIYGELDKLGILQFGQDISVLGRTKACLP